MTGVFGGVLGGMAMTIIGDVFPENRRGAATGVLMTGVLAGVGRGGPDRPDARADRTAGTRPSWSWPGLCVPLFILAAGVLPRLDGHLKDQRPRSRRGPARATFLEPNHLRAFALTVVLMFGGFSVIPFLSPFLVANVGVPSRS